MSFTKVAPAGIGTEPGTSILIGDSLLHSTGIDIGSNTGIGVTIRKHGDATFTGIVTAASFSGSGANLTGIDATAIKHTDGSVKAQAVATGVNVTGNLGVSGVLTYEDVTNIDSVGGITARSGITIGPTAGVAGTFFADGSYVTAGILTAKTGSFSGTVTANSFSGDGSSLTGISVDSTKIETGNTKVETVDTGSDGHVKITTEGSERLRITSTGLLLGGSDAQSNTTLGTNAGDSITSGDNNTFFGKDAGTDITDAQFNTFIGSGAGSNTNSGTYLNTFIGYNAGVNNGNGHHNVFIGASAGAQNAAWDNIFIGNYSGDANSSGTRNVFIGKLAGSDNTTASDSTVVGFNALKSMTTNGGCTAIGSYALEDCTAGGNVAVGYNAMKETVSGQNNTAMGYDAATNNTGNLNVAIGRDAMKANSNGSGHDNVMIGAYSAYQATKLYRNVIIGKDAFSQYNGASDMHSSTILGYQAGYKLGPGGHNVILGAYALDGASTSTANQQNLSNNIVIGQKALQNAKTSTNGCIVMGENAGQNAATGTGTYSYWSGVIAIGKNCLKDATGGSDNVVAVGNNCLEYHTGDGDGSSGGYTVAYGPSALRNNRHIRHSVAFGNTAGNDWNPAKGNLHEGGSTFIGGGAGRTCTTGGSLIAIGRDALSGGGPCTGNHNTAIGSRCFERISSGSNNCAVGGLYTGIMVTTGSYNNFFGSLAGYAYNVNTTGTGNHNNVYGGYSAASAAGNDHENIFGGGLTGKGANTTFIRGSVYNSPNSSSFSTTSDERIKKNIVDNNTGLDAIEKIRVRNFEYRTQNEITDFDNAGAVVVDKEGVQLGVIAQEIKDILPDLVKQNTTGAYAVDPDNLTWYLVNAVKELSAEVKSLKAQINS